jgi:hypothetical protein
MINAVLAINLVTIILAYIFGYRVGKNDATKASLVKYVDKIYWREPLMESSNKRIGWVILYKRTYEDGTITYIEKTYRS